MACAGACGTHHSFPTDLEAIHHAEGTASGTAVARTAEAALAIDWVTDTIPTGPTAFGVANEDPAQAVPMPAAAESPSIVQAVPSREALVAQTILAAREAALVAIACVIAATTVVADVAASIGLAGVVALAGKRPGQRIAVSSRRAGDDAVGGTGGNPLTAGRVTGAVSAQRVVAQLRAVETRALEAALTNFGPSPVEAFGVGVAANRLAGAQDAFEAQGHAALAAGSLGAVFVGLTLGTRLAARRAVVASAFPVTVGLGALGVRGPGLVHTVRRRGAAAGDRLVLADVRGVTGVRSADVQVVTVHVGLAAWTQRDTDGVDAVPVGNVVRALQIGR